MSLVEAQKGMTDLIPCNDRCGCDYGPYSFEQNDAEVTVIFPLPPNTTSKALDVRIATSTLFVCLKGQPVPLLQGQLFKPIKAAESLWSIEERKRLIVTLTKGNVQYEEWWPHVVIGERQIDMKTLKPPTKHIREFDDATQATVAKMMFDQNQKRMGLPTSDQLQMEEMLRKAGASMPPGFTASSS